MKKLHTHTHTNSHMCVCLCVFICVFGGEKVDSFHRISKASGTSQTIRNHSSKESERRERKEGGMPERIRGTGKKIGTERGREECERNKNHSTYSSP